MSATVLATLRSAAVLGIDAYGVQVEVDVSFGLPSFTMVGLPDATVRESRDRVRSAIRNSGYPFPSHRITINLAPADIRKAGAAFDLPIALGILAATGNLAAREVDAWLVIGELSLDGAIQPTRGVLPIAIAARRAGVKHVLLPTANAQEASVVADLHIAPAACLGDALRLLQGEPLTAAPSRPPSLPESDVRVAADFADVRGQWLARRALEVAAAGGHNVLLVGPPGSGKTMMARRVPGILPPLTFEEALELTAVHSVAGQLQPGEGLVRRRPFRAPHHTISNAALVGGGSIPRPGEISLAHHGVLFLDEMPEFSRHVLEVLRQPLEEGRISVARAARTVVFPARFVLVGAMNPCPCGYLGHPARECRCAPQAVERYGGRLSGPLRDRIDMTVQVPAMTVDALNDDGGESSATIRARVAGARRRQGSRAGATLNAALDGRALRDACALDADADRLLRAAASRLALSARAYDRVLKVARTIADLADTDRVGAEHVGEALQYRVSG